MPKLKSIIFFADGSEETQAVLQRVLLSRTFGSLLDRFLEQSRQVLQEELRKIPQIDRAGLPEFHNLSDFLSDKFDESLRHPALHPTEIVLAQLGSFIAAYERQAHEEYPIASEHVIVGICFGELSASAVTLASSLVELIPFAVEAVRLAFRCGILSSRVGSGLEKRSRPALSWSTVLTQETGLANESTLERVAAEAGIPKHRRLYLSASSRKTVTVGGPPSSLAKLLSHPAVEGFAKSRRDIKIFAPYHSPFFSKEETIEVVRGSFCFLKENIAIATRQIDRAFIGCATGDFYVTEGPQQLLENVVYNILAQPIRWERVLQGCEAAILSAEASNPTAWRVRPFGQTKLAGLLATSLRSIDGLDVVFDDQYGNQSCESATATQFPIAIVGIAGRFPNAENPDAFWKDLKAGRDHHKEIPEDRFEPSTHLVNPAYGCFLEKPGLFDAQFFNISPREALQTDPGQRLALVTAYEALENSGFVPNRTPSSCLSRVGTFYGQVADEYKEQNMAQEVDTYFIPGSMRAFAAGRINHFFKFGGPALNCDTACSSSSVALQMACNSIWNRECDTAIVGGMNICTSSDNFNGLTAGHFLSPTGGCKTWDQNADGYCRGEAVASVVIKPLDAAQNDNDNVLAVIKSVGTNYSSHADSITRPHAGDQENLYRQVLHDAGVKPMEIDYVEMHGTGTQVGDTVEMASVTNLFAPNGTVRPQNNPLFISAVKPNIGHGESASGITALIKVLLVLREQYLPPHVGIKSGINPKFPDLQSRNVSIAVSPTRLSSKREKGSSRHVLLNNFSAAGGNTACVLEEPPTQSSQATQPDTQRNHIVAISARSPASLLKNVENLLSYMDQNPNVSLPDLSYTTTARRVHYPIRQGIVTSSIQDLKAQLYSLGQKAQIMRFKKPPKVVFCFTGQGAFTAAFARDLFQRCPSFRDDLTRFSKITQAYGFGDFLPAAVDEDTRKESLSPGLVHLAMTAVQIALVRLLRSMNIAPSLSVGHSLGEYGALYASGALSETDVLYLVGRRACLVEKSCPQGLYSMLVVHAGKDVLPSDLYKELPSLEIACLNSPQQIVLSGLADELQLAMARLKKANISSRKLDMPFGFHSSQMDLLLNEFEHIAAGANFQPLQVPLASPVLSSILPLTETISPSYLRRHLREPNNFHGALEECKKQGLLDETTVWLELGPHPICLDMVKATAESDLRALPTLQQGGSTWSSFTRSISALYSLGIDINWQACYGDDRGERLLSLPTYGWNEKNYWIPYKNDWLLNKGLTSHGSTADPSQSLGGPNTTSVQRLISRDISGDKVSLTFESDLTDPSLHALIAGHVINGSGLFPASAYIDIALTVANYVRSKFPMQTRSAGIDIGPLEILGPILLPTRRPEEKKTLRICAAADLSVGEISISYLWSPQGSSTLRESAKCKAHFTDSNQWLSTWAESEYLLQSRIECLARDLTTGSTNRFSRGMAYKLFGSFVEYHPKFQGMQEILFNSNDLEAMATLDLYKGHDAGSFHCSPFWVDSLLHLSGFILNVNDKFDDRVINFISDGCASFKLTEDIDPRVPYQVYAKMQDKGGSVFVGNISIFRASKMIGRVESMKFKGISHSLLNTIIPPPISSSGHQQSSPSRTNTPYKVTNEKTPMPERRTTQTQALIVPTQKIANQSNPSGPVDEALKTIALEVGSSVSEIPLDSSLSELGIDSLLSLTIASKLSHLFSVELSPAIFQGDMIIRDLLEQFSQAAAETRNHIKADSYPESVSSIGGVTPLSSTDSTIRSSLQASAVNSDPRASRLRSLVAEQLQVEVDELMGAENLTVLGIDSLMSLEIIEAVRTQFGTSLSVDLLTQGISMAHLEEALNLPTAASILATQSSQQDSAVESRVPLSILLQGTSGPDGENLFMFPDGSGSATSYLSLPTISPNLRVYGLNSPFLKKRNNPSFVLEDLIQHWISEIQILQPNGPYLLGGWSAGGYYAFEAAKSLIRVGKEVKKLILIDTPPMNVYEAMPPELLEWLDRNQIMGGENSKASPTWLIDHFQATLKTLGRYSPTPLQGLPDPQVYIIWAKDAVSPNLLSAVPSPPLRAKVSYFLTQQRSNYGPHGWERLLSDCPIFLATSSGSHFTMVLSPNNSELSNLISAALISDDTPEGFMRHTR